MHLRRLGPDPHANGAQTAALHGCPDLFEMDCGDFAVIGIDITETARAALPPSAGCGPDERIIRLPRKTLVGEIRYPRFALRILYFAPAWVIMQANGVCFLAHKSLVRFASKPRHYRRSSVYRDFA